MLLALDRPGFESPLSFIPCGLRTKVFISLSLRFKMRLLREVNVISLLIKLSQKGAWRSALWGKKVMGFAN